MCDDKTKRTQAAFDRVRERDQELLELLAVGEPDDPPVTPTRPV